MVLLVLLLLLLLNFLKFRSYFRVEKDFLMFEICIESVPFIMLHIIPIKGLVFLELKCVEIIGKTKVSSMLFDNPKWRSEKCFSYLYLSLFHTCSLYLIVSFGLLFNGVFEMTEIWASLFWYSLQQLSWYSGIIN